MILTFSCGLAWAQINNDDFSLIPSNIDDNSITSLFTDKEKQWIKDHPVISVGIDANWPPIDFINDSGQHQGITHDYIEILRKQTGIQFSTTAANGWSDMLDKARERKIDIVATFAKRAEREKYWKFTTSYFQAPYVIATRKEQNNITGLESLYGKTVAIEKGYNFQTELSKNHSQINLLVVNNTASALQAVSRNKADAYVGNQAVIFHVKEQYRLTNLKVAADTGYPVNKLHFGIRSDWPELVSIIDKVLHKTRHSLLAKQVERTWLGLVPQIQPNANGPDFTLQELNWLKKHPEITVGVMNSWPPFNFLNKNGDHTGIGADLIRLINQQLDNRLTIVPGEWKNIYDAVEQKQLDAIMDITPKKEREPSFNFTAPYLDVPHIFIAQKNSEFIQSESTLGSKTLALEKGFGNVKYFRQKYPEVKIKLYKNTTTALEAVSRREADVYAGNRVVALYLIEKLALSNLKVHGRLSKSGSILSIGTRKDYPILRDIIQKSLNHIGEQELKEIKNRWVFKLIASRHKGLLNLTVQENNWLAQHRVIPIGIDGNWPPIDFMDENNEFKGITADYLALIGKKIGVKFNPQKSDSFKQMLTKVMSGELKTGATISFKQERAEKLLFSQPFFHVQKVIITRQEESKIHNIESLSGKTVVIEDGFLTMHQLEESHPDIKLTPVNSTLEALQQVSWGKADAYVGNQAVANWLSTENQLNNLKIVGDPGLGKGPQNFAVSKTDSDWAPLVEIFDKALASITIQEKQNIENRWLGRTQPAPLNLVTPLLTHEEKAWLETHPEIILGVDSSWQPLEYMDEQDQYKGLSSDYMNYISRQLGITFKAPENIPWILVIQGLKDKTIDLTPLVSKTEKRTQYLNFTESYLEFSQVLFTRRGQVLLRGLDDLKGKKLGVVNGYAVSESIRKDHPNIQQIYFANTEEGLDALLVGEIDSFIDVLAVGGYLIAAKGLSSLQVASSTPYNYQFSIGVRKDWPELVNILNKAFTVMPNEKKNEFLKNWLVLPSEQRVDYTLLYWVLGIALSILVILGLRAREMDRVNEKLKESRERLSLSLESAELGTWEITFQRGGTPIFKWDETFASQHKLPNDQKQHNPANFYNYISPEDKDEVKTTLTKYIKDGTAPLKVEYLTRFNKRWICSQGRIFKRDAKGWAHRIVGISQDITERKEAHQALERSSHFKSQFLSNMSHEIRTPMNAIVGLGHLLSRTDLNEKQIDYIDNLQKSSQTLLSLIDDILDLSKIEAGHLNIENIEFSLEELLNDLANLSVIRINKKIEFIYDMGADVPDMLMGDPFRINQVLTNLITNSIKFTESGNIILRVIIFDKPESRQNKVWLQFEVSDTGIGIAADKLGKLFDPFVQEDSSTTRKYGGTGLGLSISKQLTKLMGGDLGAESIQGEGSKFYFKLPFTVMNSSKQSLLHHPGPDLTGLKILLVDDNLLSLNILKKTLESMTFSVTAVSSGKQALQLLHDESTYFDVVLLDWRMPDMDGEQTSLMIRKQIPKHKLPIIILMTAYGREAAEQKINHMPLDGYLVKPITPSQLFNVIIQARKGFTNRRGENDTHNSQGQTLLKPLKGHVLLAEDNKINQQVAQEILQQMGLNVTISSNGVEVMETLETFTPDLILMDIQMPKMDGYETTDKIRQQADFKDLPIIAMTANAMMNDVKKSLQTGMNGHISKPVDPLLLYQTLAEYLPVIKHDEQQQSSSSMPDSENITTVSSSWPDVIPGLNIKQGIKQVGGNEQLYQKLLHSFVQNHDQLVVQLEQAIASGSNKKAERLIHTIKGVSGNIGANKLMKIATDIEQAFKQNIHLPEYLMHSLNETCEELFNSLKPLINQHKKMSTDKVQNKTIIDKKDLQQLISALQTGDSKSSQIIQQMAPALNSMLGEKAIQTLINLVKDYEFEKASEWLQKSLEDNHND